MVNVESSGARSDGAAVSSTAKLAASEETSPYFGSISSPSRISYDKAMVLEPPKKFSRASIILSLSCLVAFFSSAGNGFDSSLFNSLLQNSVFKQYFQIENVGMWTGIVASLYQIGSLCAVPFIGLVADTMGRRGTLLIGSTIMVLGTVLQGSMHHQGGAMHQFMAGRFCLGFGVSISASAGVIYVAEVSHPAHRGVMTGLYNTFWVVGSICAASATRGSVHLDGQRSWLVPVWMQLLFASLMLLFAWTIPESPRWLYVNNKKDAARDMLITYHGEGNPDSAWVRLQLQEFEEYLVMDGSDKRWWDYSALFKTRSARYRLMSATLVSMFGQWAGNAVLTYFLGGVLDTAGYRSSVAQMNITLIRDFFGFTIAVFGASCVDKFGRRPLLIGTNIGCAMVWIGMVAATSRYAASIPPGSKIGTDTAAAKAALAMIFLFSASYSIGFTSVQALYPVEVLSFEMRGKGTGFHSLAVNVAGLLNQFVWPASLKAIAWKTYIVFIFWCLVQATVIYLVIPETKNRTLEEIDDIFNAKNPVKKSLEKKHRSVELD